MQITIGEIANELVLYSNMVEMNISNGFPFIRAHLSGINNTTRSIMYVIQVADNTYSVCDDYNDLLSNRYFPTGSISKPFIVESEMIDAWFNSKSSKNNESQYGSIVTNISYTEFLDYLYDRLWFYEISRFDPKSKDLKISEDLGINNIRVKSAIDRSFNRNNCKSNTIGDLINIVSREGKPFGLETLREKDINFIYNKLKDFGIIITVSDKKIVRIALDRQK